MNSSYPPTACLVSGCLMGLCCRYDARLKANPDCIHALRSSQWVPICPEQLGGLPTPRPAADIIDGDGHDVLSGRARVRTSDGTDVTANFIRGAEQVLQLARALRMDTAILKARSPSCSVNGTIGVTAALLAASGLTLREY